MRLCALVSTLLLFAPPAARTAASAPRATALAARHHDGQTFLTWTSPPGVGWKYRVYASGAPIALASDLARCDSLGRVGDSTWCDLRLYHGLGKPYGFRPDSSAAPLDSTRGLFVALAEKSGTRWFAVVAESAGTSAPAEIVPGVNALAQGVAETPSTPEPVWQRSLPVFGRTVEFYTLWTSNRATPGFPAMANVPGLAFDCGFHRSLDPLDRALFVVFHPRGGSLLDGLWKFSSFDRNQFSLDDGLPNGDNTYWLGYHQGFDVRTGWLSQPEPSGDQVPPWTERRVLHTVAWARRHFPVDTTRLYTWGISMGGIGATRLATLRPDWVAGALAIVGKVDFTELADPDPRAQFNSGMWLRRDLDHVWAPVSADPPCAPGWTTFERSSLTYAAGELEGPGLPPITLFSGRNDFIVGWAEKPPFYRAMEAHHQGGDFYWDPREHTQTLTSFFAPMQSVEYLTRFRTDLSFPVFTRCSADRNPGDGSPATGDSVGTLRGFVTWDPEVEDQPNLWKVTLRPRDLSTRDGPWAAPETVVVDVTPRRLQSLVIVPRALYHCLLRVPGAATPFWEGYLSSDALGLVTVPGVPVTRAGVELEISHAFDTGVGPGDPPPALAPSIRLSRQPVRGSCLAEVAWPGAGPASLALRDVAGRLVRTVAEIADARGAWSGTLDASGLPAGLYFLDARQSGARAAARVVVIR